MMEYQEALAFIRELTKFGFNFGLSRITKLLELLGNPENSFKSVHVGGTNGKGSVCAFTAAVLQSAGYKTGLFTSPHLHSYTERMRINGANISKEDVAKYILMLKPLLEQMVKEGYEHPTEFEVTTAIAFKYFADAKVDIAVIEVGLGGAIDSTNVIQPIVTAITNVSFDHMDYLGTTIKEITQVKAGIIKNGVPCVTGAQAEALDIIDQHCQEKAAPLVVVGKADVPKVDVPKVVSPKVDVPKIPMALLGEHQLLNGEVALGIITLLQEQGFVISDEAITQGFSSVRWPGRLEIVSQEPLVILDAAHNHAGAVALSKALPEIFPHKAIFLIGILQDKERFRMLDQLLPLMSAVVVTKPLSPRAGDWQGVQTYLEDKNIPVTLEEDIQKALALSQALAKETSLPLVITGSIYMIASARGLLLNIEQE